MTSESITVGDLRSALAKWPDGHQLKVYALGLDRQVKNIEAFSSGARGVVLVLQTQPTTLLSR